jgi:hypothetical protein
MIEEHFHRVPTYQDAVAHLATDGDDEWLYDTRDPYLSMNAHIVSDLWEVKADVLRQDVLDFIDAKERQDAKDFAAEYQIVSFSP